MFCDTSPLPFGFLPPGFGRRYGWSLRTRPPSPLPFGFLPPGFPKSSASSPPASASGLHCLSAFCPPGSGVGDGAASEAVGSSPLPFGFLPPGFKNHDSRTIKRHRGLHCLSAFCPPGSFGVCETIDCGARRLHCLSAFCPPGSVVARVNQQRKVKRSLHCLSAFCPRVQQRQTGNGGSGNVSIAFRLSAPRVQQKRKAYGKKPVHRLHCLSAFCPPGSDRGRAKSIGRDGPSPLPFGFLPPGFGIDTGYTALGIRASPLPFGFLPPGFDILAAVKCLRADASPLPFGFLPPGFHRCLLSFSCGKESPLPFGFLPPGFTIHNIHTWHVA